MLDSYVIFSDPHSCGGDDDGSDKQHIGKMPALEDGDRRCMVLNKNRTVGTVGGRLELGCSSSSSSSSSFSTSSSSLSSSDGSLS
ncbi:hypothetical protein Tco_0671175 [Tanacetum coccineum]